MSNDQVNVYEGMFLFPLAATANLKAASDHVQELLKRADAEIISFRKWDERRLAFEIKGNKRGVYFLVYFKVAGSRLVDLERDCNLSEQLLRSMVTKADHLTDEQIQAADGQQELADEIQLRDSEEKAAAAATTATATAAPAATETEAPAATATEEPAS